MAETYTTMSKLPKAPGVASLSNEVVGFETWLEDKQVPGPSAELLPSSDAESRPTNGAVSFSIPLVDEQLHQRSQSAETIVPDVEDEADEEAEAMAVSNFGDEDAQSLIELSISTTASRLKSKNTPALEKMAAMEEGNTYFEIGPDTPSAEEEPESLKDSRILPEDGRGNQQPPGMSQDAAKPNIPEIPISAWHAGPRSFVVHNKDGGTQTALSGVFSNRTRSLSGGAEALKRLLPKGLPSMASVSNLFSFSNDNGFKFGSSSSFSKDESKHGRSNSSGTASPLNGMASIIPSARYETPLVTRRQPPLGAGGLVESERPKNLRRVTSHDSLLYHSLSRASSLGDDARFENQREQVNSRAKAIRDSLQDRSSFRMPQMPNMSMPRVPSFGFNMTFLSNSPPARGRSETDELPDILPGAHAKKKSISKPAISPGLVGATISRPDATIETVSAVEGSNSSIFDRTLEQLTGDIVIMGGYRGSILRSTKTNRQVWVPVKVGLNIRKVDLEVGLDPEDEERMAETIYASGMLQNIGPVDISKRLFKRLSECENAKTGKLRVWDYGYDWRLSPHILSRKLTEFLEKLPSNQPSLDGTVSPHGGALVIAHSLGGLITRHVVNHRPELFSGVIYAGVPHACVNILGPLRNGDAVLLSSRVLTAQVNFTLRTSFVLLPEDGQCFIDINTREQYKVDFFDINDWIKYRFSPCIDPPLPPRNPPVQSGLGSILSMPSLLNLPIPGKKSISGSATPSESISAPSNSKESKTTRAADAIRSADGGTDRTLAPQMGGLSNPVSKGQSTNSSISTTVTIPREKALSYLERTLAETKRFKQQLHHRPLLQETNRYPPLALIYGKSIPTVYGAKVDGREGIACSDVYDNLAFASGDGVCLAKEAMLPDGYKAVLGGRISSDRGHVTLLGDLNAVGKAIAAVQKGRNKGIGLGALSS